MVAVHGARAAIRPGKQPQLGADVAAVMRRLVAAPPPVLARICYALT